MKRAVIPALLIAAVFAWYSDSNFALFTLAIVCFAVGAFQSNAGRAGLRGAKYQRRHFGLTTKLTSPVAGENVSVSVGGAHAGGSGAVTRVGRHPLSRDVGDTGPDMTVEDFNRATRISGQPIVNPDRRRPFADGPDMRGVGMNGDRFDVR